MQNQSKREKLIAEYNELLEKEKEVRNAGKYDLIGNLHLQIHQKSEEIRNFNYQNLEDVKKL